LMMRVTQLISECLHFIFLPQLIQPDSGYHSKPFTIVLVGCEECVIKHDKLGLFSFCQNLPECYQNPYPLKIQSLRLHASRFLIAMLEPLTL
jgi:hypothetical protein